MLTVRGGVAAVAVLLAGLVAAPLAGAAGKGPPLGGSMAVSASSHSAGAHAVRLKFTLRYEMQCAYPGGGPLIVTFPSALKLPADFAVGTVLLSGKPVPATVSGRQVAVTVPPHKGMLCNIVAPGSLTLVFTHAAKLANPARAGSYHFTARHGTRAFTAALTIKQAA